ncbi:Type II secretion system protein [Exiguobacterium sp. 8H]|uniref:type II secretion system F family protein n=1 Tax=unclassified Exiguobacterium TaxID=2644629 RepID=UPI0012F35294|nr:MULTISPECIES: type II secretion system F family protein [unclassified Exiguobacterium]VXB31587.1 Type II secretion system protein [Exiguobacterium sp. 8H]VXB32750.1 Type II secretion system protein [Exiguobacterium sp. 8A]
MVNVPIIPSIRMIHRFLRLQSRGVSLKVTMETLELHEKGKMKDCIREMRVRLEAGVSLSEVFSILITNRQMQEILHTADRNGRFMDGLSQVAMVLEMRQRLKQELRRLIRYPLIIFFILLALGMIYALYIFPKLMGMVDVSSHDGIESILLSNWFFPMLFSIFVVIAVLIYGFHRRGGELPFYVWRRGKTLYMTYVFVSELSLLQHTETNIRQIMSRLAEEEGEMAEMAKRIHHRMSEGEGIEAATRCEPFIDHEVVSLLGVGSMSGELGKLMSLHRDLVFEEMEQYSRGLIEKIEPSLYGILSVMVGVLFYTLYLPVKLIMAQL